MEHSGRKLQEEKHFTVLKDMLKQIKNGTFSTREFGLKYNEPGYLKAAENLKMIFKVGHGAYMVTMRGEITLQHGIQLGKEVSRLSCVRSKNLKARN
jgi:hypothetical protein